MIIKDRSILYIMYSRNKLNRYLILLCKIILFYVGCILLMAIEFVGIDFCRKWDGNLPLIIIALQGSYMKSQHEIKSYSVMTKLCYC
jgi:hypothetical protein